MTDMVDGLAFYFVFVFSVTCHEAAHAWAAKRGGDLTAYLGGQVSLDPIPHMRREPFGMVIVPLITVSTIGWPLGWASAPYDPVWAQRYPRRAGWMALAGPGANLALVLAAAFLIHVGIGMGEFQAPDSLSFKSVVAAAGVISATGVDSATGVVAGAGETASMVSGIAFILSLIYSMNLLLGVLNMLPVPPLDGSGALPLILPSEWNDTYQRLAHQPMFGLIGIILVWNLVGEIFWPIFHLSIGFLYPGLTYS